MTPVQSLGTGTDGPLQHIAWNMYIYNVKHTILQTTHFADMSDLVACYGKKAYHNAEQKRKHVSTEPCFT